ncbi:MAG: hypothetical protein ACYT04_28050 [Nostoc sp.]
MQSFANKTAIASIWIKSHLDANTIQKIATRAFKAIDRMAFGKAKKVRFKQKGQFASLEGKTNKQGIRWTGNGVEWSKLKLQAIITNDPVILHGLSSKIKYVRLVRRILNQKTYWFAQKERQRAEGRRQKERSTNKNFSSGSKAQFIKRIVSRRVAQDTKRPCFNPTFLNVGSLLPSASCLLPSECKKIPHLAAGDFYYLSTKLAAELTELTSSRSNQERGVSHDVANSEVS